MSVKFLFLAQCADWMNQREMEATLPSPISLEQLLNEDPRFSKLLSRKGFLKVAVNQSVVDFKTEVEEGDEVAFMPPYSGG